MGESLRFRLNSLVLPVKPSGWSRACASYSSTQTEANHSWLTVESLKLIACNTHAVKPDKTRLNEVRGDQAAFAPWSAFMFLMGHAAIFFSLSHLCNLSWRDVQQQLCVHASAQRSFRGWGREII